MELDRPLPSPPRGLLGLAAPRDTHRATVFLDPDVLRALQLRAARTGISVSVIVNEAVRRRLTDCPSANNDLERPLEEWPPIES